MQDQQILNATITIEEVIDKEKKLSIKATNGQRSFTYSVWKTKQDGTDSQTYAQFKTLGLKVGSTVMIGYVIDEYETEIGGFPKKIQSKKIINFRETTKLPSQTAPQGKSSNGGANRGHSGQSSSFKDDAFWEKQAYEKCCSLWASADMSAGKEFRVIMEKIQQGQYWDFFRAIKADGAKRFSAPLDGSNLDLPVIQQGDDLNVDSIPF
jgi:hypothetical protein